jgi:hypothetical protein
MSAVECSFCYEQKIPVFWSNCGKFICAECVAVIRQEGPKKRKSSLCQCEYSVHEFKKMFDDTQPTTYLSTLYEIIKNTYGEAAAKLNMRNIANSQLAKKREIIKDQIAEHEVLRTRISQLGATELDGDYSLLLAHIAMLQEKLRLCDPLPAAINLQTRMAHCESVENDYTSGKDLIVLYHLYYILEGRKIGYYNVNEFIEPPYFFQVAMRDAGDAYKARYRRMNDHIRYTSEYGVGN